MQLSGAEIICECLLEQGVDTVFGYPGGAALNTYDALYKYSDKINHILTAHEQGASHAADGYARATGKTGVVITTSGGVPLILLQVLPQISTVYLLLQSQVMLLPTSLAGTVFRKLIL